MSSSRVAPSLGQITQLLKQAGAGNRDAESVLVPLVYQELRRRARKYLRFERPDHTLQPTALVHEAYLKLKNQGRVSWQNRDHFYKVAARVMRRILIDHAREVKASKRGGSHYKVPIEPDIALAEENNRDVLAIDEALKRLECENPRHAQVVELRFFGGFTEEEIASILGLSVRTVKRDWRVARAWLYAELHGA